MSSEIYAKPDSFKKVRYNRKVQEDKVEWEEIEVAIYENTDAIRDDHTDFQSHEGEQHIEKHPPAVQRGPFRAAAFCLGVLCFLMITGIIVLSIHYVSVTLEKDQLQTRNNKLSKNISDMAVNNSQLLSRYETLSKTHSQLQDEVKQLKAKIEEKWCPEGWKRFGCSCYFKSKEKKTWYESRRDCLNKGANLVIINNKEEQKFVIELNTDGESWIGLWPKWTTTTGRPEEWEWVDRSPLTEMFWASGLPNTPWNAAACCDKQGKWTQGGYDDIKNWICEK